MLVFCSACRLSTSCLFVLRFYGPVNPIGSCRPCKVCCGISAGCRMLVFCSACRLSTSCLFVLRFYGPVNPIGSCLARSVYLTTHLLGRLGALSG